MWILKKQLKLLTLCQSYIRIINVKKKSDFIDIALNYTALLIGGISGIIINVFISYSYGPKGLGIFNQIYAYYVILSQLAVGGIHLSALKHVASWQGSSAQISKIAWSSLWLSIPIAGFFAFFCYTSSFYMNYIFLSSEVAEGIRYTSLALVFFSCNKIMLFTLNALQEMRTLAFWQTVRFFLIITFAFILIFFGKNASTLGLTFTFSEGVLFIGLFLTNAYKIPYLTKSFSIKWMKKHFDFGLRGFCNGLLLELNTRVDILILGIFTSDVSVGLYSFAGMLIEGILGLLVVIRNQLNPLLAKLLKGKNILEIQELFKKRSFYVRLGTISILIIGAFFYIPFLSYVLKLDAFTESYYFFLILMGGVCFYSAYFPFDNMLLLSGYPGKQSLLAFFATFTNIIFNLCLVPIWGAYGAAIGTALAMACTLLYFKLLLKKYLGFRLSESQTFFFSQTPTKNNLGEKLKKPINFSRANKGL